MSFAVTLPERGTFDAWRAAARTAISQRIPPDQIDWTGSGGLFAAAALPDDPGSHQARVQRMHAAGASQARSGAAAISTRYRAAMDQAPDLPETLENARLAASRCQRCTLCEAASQTVWGAGAQDAALMIVGEAPGDHEDLAGQPFIGPAGQLLRQAMAEAAIDPARVWLTNAVKHFKFTPRGKQRLHQSPDRFEIEQCRWWLGLELGFIRPRLTFALGASAAFALTGNAAPLGARRGAAETGLHGGQVLVSWHPAHILRLADRDQQDRARRELALDLGTALGMASGGR